MNKPKRSAHFQDDSSIHQVWRGKGEKQSKMSKQEGTMPWASTRTLWLSKKLHTYGCNLSRQSVQDVFSREELTPRNVSGSTSCSGLRVTWIQAAIPLLPPPSLCPWVNNTLSLSVRFLLWRWGWWRLFTGCLDTQMVPTQWVTSVNSSHQGCSLALQAEWIPSSYCRKTRPKENKHWRLFTELRKRERCFTLWKSPQQINISCHAQFHTAVTSKCYFFKVTLPHQKTFWPDH